MLSPYHPLQLALGLAVWITWFALMYGALAIACEVAPPPVEHGSFTWINIALLSTTLVITGLLLYWANECWRATHTTNKLKYPSRRFIAKVATSLNLVAAIATLSLGLIVLILPPCL